MKGCFWQFQLLATVVAQVSITVQPRWPAVVAGSRHTQALLVDLTAPVASTVPPQELALVVDISLSMTEHLKLVKSALRQLLHGLRDEDRLHLVSFHSFARPEFLNASVSSKAQFLEAVDALVPKTNLSIRPIDGGDLVGQDIGNISEGLWTAQRLLVSSIASTERYVTRRAMLFTDGKLMGGVSRYNAALDALERCKVAGVASTIVALGSRGWLREAAQVSHGDFIYLHGPQGFREVVAAASASYFPTFATNVKLRLATAFGARLGESYTHRRRREHQRAWSETFVAPNDDTDDEWPVGVLRHGRTERLLIVLDLPVYNKGYDLLKYELLYQQLVDGASVSQWQQFTQHVALPQNAVAKWPGADLLFRLDQLLLEREALRRDEEVAEAEDLPIPQLKGDGSRWSRLSLRWRKLRTSLESLAKEAMTSQKQDPSLASLKVVEQIWWAVETVKLAGRGEAVSDASRRTAEGFGVCEGAPAVRQLPSNSIEGLGLPNTR